ncbi:aldo/keto reductase, putative [Ricinus communis]|uniref:Aldo/keto reductase, putative n=1 Tax=Ricinus communis TaxID=3988 RepID=B9TF37_RICCO|nr:aldo/keto reductase, putative [Ricinus communis]
MSNVYGAADEGESIATLHRAIELGINFFDTAEVYGPYHNEELLGRAFKGRRGEVILATKFGFDIREGVRNAVTSEPAHIRVAVEGSLRRLGTDYIDLLADRGRGRRHGRTGEGGQGALSGLVRSRGGQHPPRACGASDQRAAKRVFAVGAQSRRRHYSGAARAGHRAGAVQPTGTGLPGRYNQARGGVSADRFPPPGSAHAGRQL